MFRTRFLMAFVFAFICNQAVAQVEFPLGSEVVNVRKAPYNAKGDGKTDDRAAIIAAHEAANRLGARVRAKNGADKDSLQRVKESVCPVLEKALPLNSGGKKAGKFGGGVLGHNLSFTPFQLG